ncbi:condensation domain-containing protein, partial [Amycolatopsis minnesotensis]|uniref:condensation domain-containing protein n=1 Tax=Amycolatopsis minnesotensis TaxID=337894 RepID=UPI0031DC4A0D
PPLAVQYTDYAHWQRQQPPTALAEDLAFWKTTLADAPVLTLPTDHPRPAIRSAAGATHTLTLNPDTIHHLTTHAHTHDATLFMALTAATTIWLSRHTGQTDITLGTATSGRTHTELEPLIGFFVNTLPLRTHTTETHTYTQHLTHIRTTTLNAYTHDTTPFERIVDTATPHRDPSRNPLTEAMIVLDN